MQERDHLWDVDGSRGMVFPVRPSTLLLQRVAGSMTRIPDADCWNYPAADAVHQV